MKYNSVRKNDRSIKYMRIKMFSDLTGYTQNAVRIKIKNGIWLNKKHWIKAPDGCILINIIEIEKWFEGDLSI